MGCSGLTVPMEKLDNAITGHIDRRAEAVERRREHISTLKRQTSDASAKLNRLYQAIEDGIADTTDPDLKARLAELTIIRDQALSAVERIEPTTANGPVSITPAHLQTFARAARKKLKGEDGRFRRHYVRALAQKIIVVSKTEARIIGDKGRLLQTLAAANAGKPISSEVRSFEPKWRTRHDSNV